jgi:hypothetical protein
MPQDNKQQTLAKHTNLGYTKTVEAFNEISDYVE